MKRLYKSRDNRMISGVCGGLADYFNIDATFVRLAFILLFGFRIRTVILYFICAMVMPND